MIYSVNLAILVLGKGKGEKESTGDGGDGPRPRPQPIDPSECFRNAYTSFLTCYSCWKLVSLLVRIEFSVVEILQGKSLHSMIQTVC
jgi:hypothetical protein